MTNFDFVFPRWTYGYKYLATLQEVYDIISYYAI